MLYRDYTILRSSKTPFSVSNKKKSVFEVYRRFYKKRLCKANTVSEAIQLINGLIAKQSVDIRKYAIERTKIASREGEIWRRQAGLLKDLLTTKERDCA